MERYVTSVLLISLISLLPTLNEILRPGSNNRGILIAITLMYKVVARAHCADPEIGGLRAN